MNYRDEIQGLLLKLPHELNVSFALHCAMDVNHLVPPEHKAKANLCIDLVQRWLKGEQGLEDELRAVAYTAAIYTTNVSYAAHAAYNAANAVAHVANTAAASDASYASAASAAYAAAYAANRNSDKIKEYYKYLVNMVREMPEIEKLIWDINL